MIRAEVVAHFNEEPFSHGLAAGLARRVEESRPEYRCPIHDQEPLVRVSTQGVAQALNDISVEIVACCEAARREVSRVVEEIRQMVEES
jgi:hypothetical protein